MGTFAVGRLVAVPPRQVRDVVTGWAPPSEAGPGSFRLVKVGHLPAPRTDRFTRALFATVADETAAEALRGSGRDGPGQNVSGQW